MNEVKRTTHLFPVADTIEQAREIARTRRPPTPPCSMYVSRIAVDAWDIRKDYDGYYVVPAWDRGYECCGLFVERVRYEASPGFPP